MIEAFAATAPTEVLSSPSVIEIIFNSSGLVLMVLALLSFFSVMTLAIIFSKWRTIGRCDKNSEDFLEVFWSGKSMDHIYSVSKKFHNAPVARIFQAGYKELQRLMEKERQKSAKTPVTPTDVKDIVPPESSIDNLERALNMAARSETMQLESSMTFLATTASTAPFIGLFGTVWGIMNSFLSIGARGGASLDVVAPGIAEALIATAVGLVAAIPATMAYNYFNHKIRGVKAKMENFAADFLNIVRRNFLAN